MDEMDQELDRICKGLTPEMISLRADELTEEVDALCAENCNDDRSVILERVLMHKIAFLSVFVENILDTLEEFAKT